MPALQFFKFIDEHAGPQRRHILVGSFGSGLLQGLTIAVIGMALDEFARGQGVSLRVFLLFLLCVGGYYWSFRLAMGACTGVAFETVSDIQLRISDKLRQTDYMSFMRMERSQVYSALMGNKDIVVESARFLVSFISGAVMMACAFFYAAFISVPGLLLVLAILAACGLVFVRMQHKTIAQQKTAQASEQEFLASLKDQLDGFTELKVNRAKSDDLYESRIRLLCQQAIEAKRQMERTTIRGTAFFTTFAFFPVGAVIFFLPKFVPVSTEEVIKLIAVTLFSLSPLMGFVLFIPLASKAQMTIETLLSFESFLDSKREIQPTSLPQAPVFDQIEIRGASFSYEGQNGQQPFTLTVDDFALKRGELVVLTGGNGSGKSTFMRVLAGLVPLTSGTIRVDGKVLAEVGLDNYRALFSVILSDFHLFDTLYGVAEPDPERLQKWLGSMQLAHRVRVTGRRFSTTDLSSGQRKRLALICSIMEDRDVLLFDEVAADFDFQFREYFYRSFLPELKAMGKTVFAISHDDRYFHVPDRVLTMRYGAFVPPPETAPPSGARRRSKEKRP